MKLKIKSPAIRLGTSIFICPSYNKVPDYVKSHAEAVEGFVDQHNNFYDRQEAAKIAFDAGQISSRTTFLKTTDLYKKSEEAPID